MKWITMTEDWEEECMHMQDEISSIDYIDRTIVPFVSMYITDRVFECNHIGMKKKNDVMEIKVIINGSLIRKVQCLILFFFCIQKLSPFHMKQSRIQSVRMIAIGLLQSMLI
jgi:hypothetical protein